MHCQINSDILTRHDGEQMRQNNNTEKKDTNQSIAQKIDQSQALTLYQSIPLSAKSSRWAKETCPVYQVVSYSPSRMSYSYFCMGFMVVIHCQKFLDMPQFKSIRSFFFQSIDHAYPLYTHSVCLHPVF